jgi:hypothetical protein
LLDRRSGSERIRDFVTGDVRDGPVAPTSLIRATTEVPAERRDVKYMILLYGSQQDYLVGKARS